MKIFSIFVVFWFFGSDFYIVMLCVKLVFDIGCSVLTCFLFNYGVDGFLVPLLVSPQTLILKIKYRWGRGEAGSGIPAGYGHL